MLNFNNTPRLAAAIALCGILLVGRIWAGLEVPKLQAPVNDYAQVLSSNTKSFINQALTKIHKNGGSQIAVLIVPELSGETIEQFTIRVVDQWQLGDKDKDNGVLLALAMKERKIRIEVGQGLEGDLTDAHSKRIIDESMVPLIRAGRLSEAILVASYQIAKFTNPNLNIDELYNLHDSQSLHQRPQEKKKRLSLPIILLFIIVAFLRFGFPGLFFLGSHRRGLGGGFRGGGFSGGGFGGGGGGFSGGGASGGW